MRGPPHRADPTPEPRSAPPQRGTPRTRPRLPRFRRAALIRPRLERRALQPDSPSSRETPRPSKPQSFRAVLRPRRGAGPRRPFVQRLSMPRTARPRPPRASRRPVRRTRRPPKVKRDPRRPGPRTSGPRTWTLRHDTRQRLRTRPFDGRVRWHQSRLVHVGRRPDLKLARETPRPLKPRRQRAERRPRPRAGGWRRTAPPLRPDGELQRRRQIPAPAIARRHAARRRQ
mmetsp:Transcript_18824/g.63609  ORF Transcript_18824/g.63609 Transcript_18824/m.63609 type:complete len:229 (-) Transcript_18824:685-1371(-)